MKDYTVGSGNIFADLNLPNPEELYSKTQLTLYIKDIVQQRGWTEKSAAVALGMTDLELKQFFQGEKLEHYSLGKLITFLARLEHKVSIHISSADNRTQEFVISQPSLAAL